MKDTHSKFLALAAIVLLPLFNGCSSEDSPVKIFLPLPSDGQHAQPAASSNRFEESEQANSNAIKSAIEVSEKYAQLASEAAELRQQNKTLRTENEQFQNKLKQTQFELNKTEKELKEGNDMIIETTVELNNWKNDVLGFREEMRQADIAQLQTLQKILVILGGETRENVAMGAENENSGPAQNTETQ
ncbi:MAG: hypothetical protein JW804_06430 [Sedimentisphaerales bacterium]|nr:hypothetical protein [Sedimentisphaerales bacterium]